MALLWKHTKPRYTLIAVFELHFFFLHDSVLARAQLFAAAATRLLHNWWTVVISVLIVASGRARAFVYVCTCQVRQPCVSAVIFELSNAKDRQQITRSFESTKKNLQSDEAPRWFHGDSWTWGRSCIFNLSLSSPLRITLSESRPVKRSNPLPLFKCLMQCVFEIRHFHFGNNR